MNAFHSGTDMDELLHNAGAYNYYISLVVNFSDNYVCKIAFLSKIKASYTSTIKNTLGKLIPFIRENEYEGIILGDLKVELPAQSEVESWFKERYTAVNMPKKPVPTSSGNHTTWPYSTMDMSDDDWFGRRGSWDKRPVQKTIEFDYSKKSQLPSKTELFVNTILFCDHTKEVDIKAGIKELLALDDGEFELYLEMLDLNLDLLHENVYGKTVDRVMANHLSEAVDYLTKYSTNYTDYNNLDKLITSLTEYATV